MQMRELHLYLPMSYILCVLGYSVSCVRNCVFFPPWMCINVRAGGHCVFLDFVR